jgi:hypothetical protein
MTRFAATSARSATTAARRSSPWPTTLARLEADFGHVHVDFPEGRRQIPVLITAWSYSNYRFALAMPTERTEAILAAPRGQRSRVFQPVDAGPLAAAGVRADSGASGSG